MKQPALFDLQEFEASNESISENVDAFVIAFGEEGAKTVMTLLGGSTITVPEKPMGQTYEFLEKHLGAELAKLMIKGFSHEELYIPRSQNIIFRNRQIRERYSALRSQGISVCQSLNTLALEFQISNRTAQRIVSGKKG